MYRQISWPNHEPGASVKRSSGDGGEYTDCAAMNGSDFPVAHSVTLSATILDSSRLSIATGPPRAPTSTLAEKKRHRTWGHRRQSKPARWARVLSRSRSRRRQRRRRGAGLPAFALSLTAQVAALPRHPEPAHTVLPPAVVGQLVHYGVSLAARRKTAIAPNDGEGRRALTWAPHLGPVYRSHRHQPLSVGDESPDPGSTQPRRRLGPL